jgi:putative transposase
MGYDYTRDGAYFITICVNHRLPLLGRLDGAVLCSSSAGAVAAQVWAALPASIEHVHIDCFLVMPDHVHGILFIANEGGSRQISLPDVMQEFKSRTTVAYVQGVRQQGWPRFDGTLWQRSYYDHVVRDDADLARVRTYIEENPMRTLLKQQGRRSTELAALEGDGQGAP